ncbi:alpha-L RNA-binding motif-containing protein [Mollisia scopiformis]|uniref:Alpha-L RNA-binding motif-containing protein n=1 Tax=Mollisia scopiformis TaxID=149040 RepID=A0A194XBE9_MOLSC|nr:alpha-L RNA-binding motif-containing protein [Mollisia scopiformis]KUJ17082.1 alpha-L RNA-binding motif-containing protein [Mollisia scopiformis]
MARKRFHQLKKVKFRATWNKYNLYNLSRLSMPRTQSLTFYQQKWKAKSITRAYHGEQIREKQWQRMFTPRLNAVVPMDHRYLAEFDGSELAAGRGSGLEKPFDAEKTKRKQAIPYMHQTYAPIERRLDMAIWRALFASSARQARQFVVHGKVKVNGEKMIYPGYLLNPGDLFQVEPEAVLFATGAPKDGPQLRVGRRVLRVRRNRNVGMEKLRAQMAERKAAKASDKASNKDSSKALISSKTPKTLLEDHFEYRKTREADLSTMIQRAEWKQHAKSKMLSAKRKQQIRAFIRHAKSARSKVFRKPFQELEKERLAFVEEFRGSVGSNTLDKAWRQAAKKRAAENSVETEAGAAEGASEEADAPKRTKTPYGERVAEEKLVALEKRIAAMRIQGDGVDPSKPYATPWRPRDFMSAFAFIPRYLEVSPKICSAVYLRHPVARPGLTEVPTPFPGEIQQLAFNWYLRRR